MLTIINWSINIRKFIACTTWYCFNPHFNPTQPPFGPNTLHSLITLLNLPSTPTLPNLSTSYPICIPDYPHFNPLCPASTIFTPTLPPLPPI